jgi:hypothetical protein
VEQFDELIGVQKSRDIIPLSNINSDLKKIIPEEFVLFYSYFRHFS